MARIQKEVKKEDKMRNNMKVYEDIEKQYSIQGTTHQGKKSFSFGMT